jgi:hypothetical protein
MKSITMDQDMAERIQDMASRDTRRHRAKWRLKIYRSDL